jgi:hypothetical protein
MHSRSARRVQELDDRSVAARPEEEVALVRAMASDPVCAEVDHELLPPLLEPVLAGLLEVLHRSEFLGARQEAICSVARLAGNCWKA